MLRIILRIILSNVIRTLQIPIEEKYMQITEHSSTVLKLQAKSWLWLWPFRCGISLLVGTAVFSVGLILIFGEIYSSHLGDSVRWQKVEQINALTNNPEKLDPNIQKDHCWFVYLSGGVLMLAGAGRTLNKLSNKSPIVCIFNKNLDILHLKRQNLLFESDSREERLDAIRVARVESDSEYGLSTELLLKSGAHISLGSSRNSSEVAETINQCLNS